MSRGGHRENAGRKKKSEDEKKKITRKSLTFSEDENDLLQKIEKYGKGKTFNEKIKEILSCEVERREK